MHSVFALLVAGVCGAAGTALLPDELANLPALLGNEQRLVETVRQFDLLQQALAEWDRAMAQQLREAGDKDLAEEKIKQVRQRYQVVRTAYEYVLQHYRTNALATNYYAELLYDQFHETTKAVQLWNVAAAVNPKLSQPYNNLGIHYFHIGEYRQGLKCYLTALELDPNNPDYLYNLAQAYLVHSPQIRQIRQWDAQRLYTEAMKLSKKAAENAPNDFEMLRDYALNFFTAENFGVRADWLEAAKAWQRARTQAPDKGALFYTWLYEARAWLRKPDQENAERCLKEALAIDPANKVAQGLLDKVKGNSVSKP